ncbi:MAG: FAD:protein FMN transferase [Acidimicrobiia bacterium]
MLTRTNDYWQEHAFRAMGSDAHITMGDGDPALIDWAEREVERLEASWSRFRPDSELNQLGASNGEWTAVSPQLLRILRAARALFDATGRHFDPTVRHTLEALGYDRSFTEIERDTTNDVSPTAAPGYDRVEIDADASYVRVPAGVELDLGGIGKGLAADLIAEGLVARGARSALVSMGGDLRTAGDPPDGGWDIPVHDPLDDERTAFEHPLTSGALVTSTTRIRAWTRNARRYHHLIDPRTGDAACTGIVAVTAHGATAWWSEGVAKAALIAGVETAAALADRTGVHLWCWRDDGSVAEFTSS